MAKQILSEEFRRMQKLAGLSEASGEDMGDNMYGITKEFKFGSEPGGPFKLELFSNGDMGISDGGNYLGLTNKDAKELSEILKQIMGKVKNEQLNENIEQFEDYVSDMFNMSIPEDAEEGEYFEDVWEKEQYGDEEEYDTEEWYGLTDYLKSVGGKATLEGNPDINLELMPNGDIKFGATVTFD